MNVKKVLLDKCFEEVALKINRLQKEISNIQDSLTSETKSTAGDKHETGRAMLHIERENIGVQLAEAQRLYENLSKIDAMSSCNIVKLGTLVYTSKANYFISIGLGLLRIDEEEFFAISPSSPIAQQLMGKKKGDSIIFRDNRFQLINLQ